ncbi:MAG TPA: SRPBCC family protein [Acidimicrobiales bacterium]|nr:SRPBCC family protein [Acidimicrobiales bacterium]
MAKQAEPTVVEVEERIAADASELYGLISDVTNMGRWSPENHRCRWLGGATGPAVGARFAGANKDGWRRWSTRCRVVAADEGRRFAFDVRFVGMPISRWTYELEPDGATTKVVERWDDRRWRPMRSISKVVMGVPDRPGHNRAGMEATLAALKVAAEA